MKLILLGAPGSGKGTQAKKLSKHFGLVHISTGDIIRENIKNRTKIGIEAEKLINDGNLVPDDVVIEMVANYLKQDHVRNNFVLDGFPRTVKQAEALDNISEIDKVILIDTDLDETTRRILNRKTCPKCGKSYSNLEFCPNCNIKLERRDDDNEQTIKNRFKVYINETLPVVEYYKKNHLLNTVNGNNSIEQVFGEINNILNEGSYDL